VRRVLLHLVGGALTVGLAWLALTSFATGSAIASWAPCPRNWSWTPAWGPRVSPLDSVSIRFHNGHAKICYGRPSLRGRRMLGGDEVPYGRLWRTGANEPTTIHLDRGLELGEIFLAPGSYSIYTIPGRESWQIIVNRATRQWGIESAYTDEVAAREVGRVQAPAERLESPVELFTIQPIPAGGDVWWLSFEWQDVRVRVTLDGGADRPSEPGPDREPF
jgi:hypothetical protein